MNNAIFANSLPEDIGHAAIEEQDSPHDLAIDEIAGICRKYGLPPERASLLAFDLAAELNGKARDRETARERMAVARIISAFVNTLREICDNKEKRPKLLARVGLIALGDIDQASMRALASEYRFTVEAISYMAEQYRLRHDLPENLFNKTRDAVASYRLTNGGNNRCES